MIDHLVQSTLFTALAGLLVLLLKNNRAQTRHWIWLAASLKFLVPFSLLVSIGGQLSGLLPAERAPHFTALFEEVNAGAAVTATKPVEHSVSWVSILVVVWLVGFAAVMAAWVWRWLQISVTLRDAKPLNEGCAYELLQRVRTKAGVRARVRLMSTRSALEPGVFGIWSSALLLPARVSEALQPAELEAVLAHEMVHVRRRDNLVGAVHMLVEAMFWFHPLVWWLGAQLVMERERACDEEVLRLGSESEAYAAGILSVCKLSLASPLVCVCGVTGADLKKRIEQIMAARTGEMLTRTKRLLLVGVGVVTLAAPLILGLLTAPRSVAQSGAKTAGNPTFAVASVKPTAPGQRGIQVRFAPGGRFNAENVTLRLLIKVAYDLRDDQIGGGPAWLGSKRYDVEAKCDPPVEGNPRDMTEQQRKEYDEQLRLRIQAMLADRFQLKLRQETKELPIYALTVTKNGPKFKPSAAGENDPGEMGIKMMPGVMEATRMNMEGFAQTLSEQAGRMVEDRTGLKGIYDFKLEFAADPLGGGPKDPGAPPSGGDARPADASGPSLFTALQEQLGLKLVSTKGQAPFATVEAAALPSEN